MSNDYFNPSGTPGPHAFGSSAAMRAEIALISVAFDKIAPLSGNALKLVRINASATGQESVSAIDAIPIGSTTPSTGAFTTLSASGGFTGSVTGNASTATALQTARTINGVSFNGTANITVTAAAGTLTGASLPVGVTDSFLTSVGTLGSLNVSGVISGIGSGLTTLNASNLSSGSVPLARLTLLTDQLADPTSASNGDALVAAKYQATGSAALNLHSYIEDDGQYNVMGFIAESLKAAIRNQTSTTDVDAQMQLALSAAYSESSGNFRGLYLPRGRYNLASGTTSLTFTGNRLNQALNITGAGRNATVIRQTGSSGTLLTFTNGNPTVLGPNTCQLHISDMMLLGSGKTIKGLGLLGLAQCDVTRVNLESFDVGCDIEASLTFVVQNGQASNNNTAFRSRNNGAGAYCNLIRFRDVITAGNSQYAYDIGHSYMPSWEHCDMEQNGLTTSTSAVTITNASPAVISWAAHGLAVGREIWLKTTGALPTGLVQYKGYFIISAGFGTNSFQVSATPGGAAINTSSAGSGTHTARTASGAIVIRDTCDDEVGFAQVFVGEATWFESNSGQGIRIEPMNNGKATLEKCLNLSQEGTNMAVVCGAIRTLVVRDFDAPNTNNGFTLAAESAILNNTQPYSLDDSEVTYPTYDNVLTNTTSHRSGRKELFTGTLTGCTTSPTGTITVVQQGDLITLHFPDILAVSNTTACTITGLPTKYYPPANAQVLLVTEDNSLDDASPCTIGSGGTITLNFRSGAFTAVGNKGIRQSSCSYRRS